MNHDIVSVVDVTLNMNDANVLSTFVQISTFLNHYVILS